MQVVLAARWLNLALMERPPVVNPSQQGMDLTPDLGYSIFGRRRRPSRRLLESFDGGNGDAGGVGSPLAELGIDGKTGDGGALPGRCLAIVNRTSTSSMRYIRERQFFPVMSSSMRGPQWRPSSRHSDDLGPSFARCSFGIKTHAREPIRRRCKSEFLVDRACRHRGLLEAACSSIDLTEEDTV
jgi:hypothetical protein